MAKTHDPENERLKRAYRIFLREAQSHGEATLDAVDKALSRFETYTSFRPFRAFHVNQAVAFKRHLGSQRNARDGETLSASTQYATLAALRGFFHWLAGQPRFRSLLSYSDSDYFHMPRSEMRIAKTRHEVPVPSLEQLHAAIAAMPFTTDIERRDRALVAFVVLTGARDGAIPLLKRKHVDMAAQRVNFDAREVSTKFSKSFPTWFFPVDGNALSILTEWVEYLDRDLLWGGDDPIFPMTQIERGPDHRYRTIGLARAHWASATPIRKVFQQAFKCAGLPYFPPHRVRKTLAQLGQRLCLSPEQLKAWSQNLGHESVLTTFTSYGDVSASRQAEIIRTLALAPASDDALANVLQTAVDHLKAKRS